MYTVGMAHEDSACVESKKHLNTPLLTSKAELFIPSIILTERPTGKVAAGLSLKW
jgi:hypothetical protein